MLQKLYDERLPTVQSCISFTQDMDPATLHLRHPRACATAGTGAAPEDCVRSGARAGSGSAVVTMDFAGGRHGMQAVPE